MSIYVSAAIAGHARVWAGLHYRNSGQVGVQLGRTVARYALDHYFQPTHHDNHQENDKD